MEHTNGETMPAPIPERAGEPGDRLAAAITDLGRCIDRLCTLPAPAGLARGQAGSLLWLELYGQARRLSLAWQLAQAEASMAALERWRAALDRLDAEPQDTHGVIAVLRGRVRALEVP